MESLLRIGDILPFDDNRLTESQCMLEGLLAKSEQARHALARVLDHLRAHNYRMQGRFTGRFIH